MNKRHAIYNYIGLGIASFTSLSLLRLLLYATVARRLNSVFVGLSAVMSLIFILCVGGGSFLNILRHRFSTRPTIAIVVGYFLTCFLTPLGIWGIVELYLERERRSGRSKQNSAPPAPISTGEETAPFEYRAAQISWICAVVGLLAFVFAVICHVKTVIYITIPVVAFAMLFGFILGIYALFGIRRHGPRRILIPALVGIIISGSSALLIFIGIIAGMMEGARGSRHYPSGDTINASQPANTTSNPTNGP